MFFFRTELVWPCPFKIAEGPLTECFPANGGNGSFRWSYKVIELNRFMDIIHYPLYLWILSSENLTNPNISRCCPT